jgi:hypothetical protein
LVWEETSPEKQGAQLRPVVPPQGKSPVSQTPLQQASSPQAFVVQQTSAGQERLSPAGRAALPLLQAARMPVSLLQAPQQEKASQQRLQAQQVLPRPELEHGPQEERTRTQQE